jgi:hypothetical protein
LNQYRKNPRRLTEKQFSLLQRDLAELGDLGGIVHDLNSDEIIGGNQRSKILKPSPENITLNESFDTPTKTGTVAFGYIEWQGERFPYRQVRWTPKQCEKANIVANRVHADWDFDVLANEFDMNDLVQWGFENSEFGLGDDATNDNQENDAGLQKNSKEVTCPECGAQFIPKT